MTLNTYIMSRFYSISEYTGAYLLQYAALTGLFKSKSSVVIGPASPKAPKFYPG